MPHASERHANGLARDKRSRNVTNSHQMGQKVTRSHKRSLLAVLCLTRKQKIPKPRKRGFCRLRLLREEGLMAPIRELPAPTHEQWARIRGPEIANLKARNGNAAA